MPTEASDPFISPGLQLPRGEPDPIGGDVPLSFLSPSRAISQWRLDFSVTAFQEITVAEPSLFRLNTLYQSSGFHLAPTSGEGIFFTAWPKNISRVSGVETNRVMIRSSGPLMYLPRAGTYKVELNPLYRTSVILPAIFAADCSLFPMSAEAAATYLADPPSSQTLRGSVTLAAGPGPSINIMDPTVLNIAGSGLTNWFGLVRLRVQIQQVAPVDVRISVGAVGGATGLSSQGLVGRLYEWKELAGRTVWLFNNLASTAEVALEAHFL